MDRHRRARGGRRRRHRSWSTRPTATTTAPTPTTTSPSVTPTPRTSERLEALTPALARCVGDAERFLATGFTAVPHRWSGGTFDDLLSLEDVDRQLNGGGLRRPAIRLVRDGVVLDPATWTSRARTGARVGRRPGAPRPDPRPLRRRGDAGPPVAAALVAPTDPVLPGAGGDARPPGAGQRLSDPARGRRPHPSPRHARRVRAAGPRHQALDRARTARPCPSGPPPFRSRGGRRPAGALRGDHDPG